jgi:hypothetical protein
MTITEFLLARIAEDERVARADLASDAWGNPYGDGTGIELTFTSERVLSECEAKRQIVFLTEHGCGDDYERVQRALASVYADHPDFREEWRA